MTSARGEPATRLPIAARYELAHDLRQAYLAGGRREKACILDRFCDLTGYDRTYAVRVLRERERKLRGSLPRQPRRRYGGEFQAALELLWEAAGYICAERLHPLLPELVKLLECHYDLSLDGATRAQLASASRATVERNLAVLKRGRDLQRLLPNRPVNPFPGRPPGAIARWRRLDRPGFLVIEVMPHRGDAGPPVATVCATDLSSGWAERVAVRPAGPAGLISGLDRICSTLPFPMLGIHLNVTEPSLREALVRYRGVELSLVTTASLESASLGLIRHLLGAFPIRTGAEMDRLNEIYRDLLRPYTNCFQPVMKQERGGGSVRHHVATPLARVLASGAVDPARTGELIVLSSSISPLQLKREIDRRLDSWRELVELELG